MGRREQVRETLVIDAYNLFHRLRARVRVRLSRGEERLWLQSLLRRLRASRRPVPRIVLVYDGGASEPRSREDLEKGFEVRYSGSSRTADDAILAIARNARSQDGITVVTSDLHDIVKHLGGLPVRHRSAEVVAEELARLVEPSRPEREKPDGVKSDDVSSWAREFGFPRDGRRR